MLPFFPANLATLVQIILLFYALMKKIVYTLNQHFNFFHFLGKCRKLWERFIDSARRQKSLFGTTWTALRVMLNSCELKKTYVLNPLAPEFVPRLRRKKEAYLPKMFSNLQSEVMRQPNAYAALMQVRKFLLFSVFNLGNFFKILIISKKLGNKICSTKLS